MKRVFIILGLFIPCILFARIDGNRDLITYDLLSSTWNNLNSRDNLIAQATGYNFNQISSTYTYLLANDSILTATGVSIIANQVSTYTMLMTKEELQPNLNMIALWHLNSDLFDYTGNGYNLTSSNTVLISSQSWKLNTSTETYYYFQGNSKSRLVCEQTTDIFDIAKSSQFSVSFWVRPSSVQVSYSKVLQFGDGWAGRGWEIYTGAVGNDDQFNFQFSTNTAGVAVLGSDGNVNAYQWNFLTYTFDLRNSIGKMYRDGNLIQTNSPLASIYYSTSAYLHIGNYETNGAGFHGLIDEVSMWSSVLSADEIKAYYDMGQTKYKDNFVNDLINVTTTDLNNNTPLYEGKIVYNTTNDTTYISTGTAQGDWKQQTIGGGLSATSVLYKFKQTFFGAGGTLPMQDNNGVYEGAVISRDEFSINNSSRAIYGVVFTSFTERFVYFEQVMDRNLDPTKDLSLYIEFYSAVTSSSVLFNVSVATMTNVAKRTWTKYQVLEAKVGGVAYDVVIATVTWTANSAGFIAGSHYGICISREATPVDALDDVRMITGVIEGWKKE